ncbi:MAG: hypothetical protein QM791_01735 [Ferruginibacter sp.]
MKTPVLKPLLLGAVLFQLLTSCQKEAVPDENLTATADEETEMQLLERGCRRKCVLTHTQDDLVFVAPSVFYNKDGNPETIQFDQSPVVINGKYDKQGRLRLLYYANTYDHEELIYNNRHDRYPSKINYYTTNCADYGMADSLSAVMYFKYDNDGRIIQYKHINLWYPGSDYALGFSYNSKGNLKAVFRKTQAGASFTEYAFKEYDNRSNFMGTNPWIKFMMLNTGFDPYYFLLFSENNASRWNWAYDPTAPTLYFTSKFKYNNFGFANNTYLHLKDSDGVEYGDFTRTSCSACDNDCGETASANMRQRKNSAGAIQDIIRKHSTILLKGNYSF